MVNAVGDGYGGSADALLEYQFDVYNIECHLLPPDIFGLALLMQLDRLTLTGCETRYIV
jgi:hypothetical protein